MGRQASGSGIGWRVAALGLLLVGVPGAHVSRAQPPSAPGRPVSFNQDVAPIVFAHCIECHRPGTAAPFSLLTYEDARPWARAIKRATGTRSMPPWKPVPGRGGPFLGERRLRDDEIARLAAWVDGGAPRGPGAAPIPPAAPGGWRLGEPDLVVTLPEPYLLPPGSDDVFRKFVMPIPGSAVRYVKGVEFQPGNAAVVHHANMRIDRTPAARALDDADPAPGYGGVTPFSARYPDGYFLGWTPGQLRPLEAEGMAWRLHPGSDLLLELHLMPGRRTEPVQPQVGLFFTDAPPTTIPFTIRLGKQDLDIPAGATGYVSRDDYVLPVDVEVYSLQPHAHTLATEVTGTATWPDGTRRWLIAIDDWDFDWQDVYRLVEPMFLPRGTRLTMTFVYDNSAGNRRRRGPPRRVTWGQHTSNEMGDLWIQVLPRTLAERAVLAEDRRPLQLAEDIVGFETVLAFEPDQPMMHDEVALLYLQFGRVAEAEAHFRETARLRPESPAAHYNVGTTLLQQRRLDDAVEWFHQAVRLDPDYLQAHTNLGAALRSQGDLAGAVRHFGEALRIRSDDGDAIVNLAGTLTLQGELDAAAALYRRAIARRPDAADALAPLAWILATDPAATPGAVAEAVELAERASRSSGGRDVRHLDVLAAAYAAAGRLADAVATAEAALGHVPETEEVLADLIRQRLNLYRRGLKFQR